MNYYILSIPQKLLNERIGKEKSIGEPRMEKCKTSQLVNHSRKSMPRETQENYSYPYSGIPDSRVSLSSPQ